MVAHTAYRVSSTRILLFRILCILDVQLYPVLRHMSARFSAATHARRSTATPASVRTRSTASSLAPDTRRATHMGTSAPVTRGIPSMSMSAHCSTVSGRAATAALSCGGTGATSDGATMVPLKGAGDASADGRDIVCRVVSGSKATAESNAIQIDSVRKEATRSGKGWGAGTYVVCAWYAASAALDRRRRLHRIPVAAASAPRPLRPHAASQMLQWCGSSWACSLGISHHAPCGRPYTRARRRAAAEASRNSRRRASRRPPWRSAGSEGARSYENAEDTEVGYRFFYRTLRGKS